MPDEIEQRLAKLSRSQDTPNSYKNYVIIKEDYLPYTNEARIIYAKENDFVRNKDVGEIDKIQRMITLSNKNLEELQKNPDDFISKFAEDIVRRSGVPLDACPSWYKKIIREQREENCIKIIKDNYERERRAIKNQCKKLKRELKTNDESTIVIKKKEIKNLKKTLKLRKKQSKNLINVETQNCEDDCAKIEPLNIDDDLGLKFKPVGRLRVTSVWGGMVPMDGIYIIRNRETNRFYVGKSKNVYQALGQNFIGTKPTNSKLLNDYIESKEDDDMFEFAILFYDNNTDLKKQKAALIDYFSRIGRVYN